MLHTEEMIGHLRLQRRIFLAINIAAAVAMAVLFYFIVHQQHEISKQTDVIQAQRIEAIVRECQSSNDRHDKAVHILNELLSVPGVSAARRHDTKRFTVPLISAITPKQNCNKLAEQVVPTK
jgi:hypothetical protein